MLKEIIKGLEQKLSKLSDVRRRNSRKARGQAKT